MANVQKNIIINNLSVSSDAIYNHSNNSSFSSLKENYTCRICLEKEKANAKLITPCLCKGTMRYVHNLCLKKWLEENNIKIDINNKDDIHCEICKAKYKIKIIKKITVDREKCKRFVTKYVGTSIVFIGIIIGFIYCLNKMIIQKYQEKGKNYTVFIILTVLIVIVIIVILSINGVLKFKEKCTTKSIDSWDVMNYNKKDNKLITPVSKENKANSVIKKNNYIYQSRK